MRTSVDAILGLAGWPAYLLVGLLAFGPAGLLRLPVGCEHLEGPWADLEAALDSA